MCTEGKIIVKVKLVFLDSFWFQFLGTSLAQGILLQLDRKPSKCVVFEDDPRGITAAHNCTMMAVALIGAHPAYVNLLAFKSFSQ